MEPVEKKWGRSYWSDLLERVGATFLGALLTALTVTGQTEVDWSDHTIVWTILGLPTLVALIKGLLVNLKGDEPSASLVDVTSTGANVPLL